MAMSSIPRHSHPTSPSSQRDHRSGGWAWLLLLTVVLGAMITLGYRTSRPVDAGRAAVPVSITTTDSTSVVSMAGNRDAEPLAGNPTPAYPQVALDQGIEGDVFVRLQIDADGMVTHAAVVGHEGGMNPELDRAAIQTLQQWRFRPAMRDGQAINSVVQVPVEFRNGR